MAWMAFALTVLTVLFLIMGYLYFSQRALARSVKDAQPLWPLNKPDRAGDPSAIMSRRTNALDVRTAREPEGSARPAPAPKPAAVASVAATPAKKLAVKKASAATAAAPKPAVKKVAAIVAPTPAPVAKKPAAVKSAGPERLKKPNGKADDLKKISGVGPKLEKTLNDLGFWHFKQIAQWKKSDVAIVDNELSFKGRIERDNWIAQAKVLAKGK